MLEACTWNESFACWKFFTVKYLDSVLNVAHIFQSGTWLVWLCENKIWVTDVSRISPSFLQSGLLTNSEFRAARYCTLAQVQWTPSILSLRVYSDLCLVLIVSPSVARSLKLSPFFKRRNKFTYYSSVLHVLRDKPMTLFLTLSAVCLKACRYLLHHQF
jgi:hypothetical protein